jgi:hypothetical protein
VSIDAAKVYYEQYLILKHEASLKHRALHLLGKALEYDKTQWRYHYEMGIFLRYVR